MEFANQKETVHQYFLFVQGQKINVMEIAGRTLQKIALCVLGALLSDALMEHALETLLNALYIF